jgi:predicted short-subunit dehydrogenase-like oxidoreductase (DUF2520 family)
MITVTLIGAGNVATHLYKVFNTTEKVLVKQWYNRNLKPLEPYKTKVEITNCLEDLKETDVYIIAVSDDAISELSTALPFSDRLVVHTSGSARLYDIDMKHKRGVFYPLQTFSKEVDLDFTEVPICIEALHKPDYKLLKNLGLALGCAVHKVNSNQRRALHLAAVFANNFTNHMYRIAHEICENDAAEFDILKPLIKETARKIETVSPYRAQTGPAKRGDKKTLKKQLNALENPTHKAIYENMTKSIKKTYGQR